MTPCISARSLRALLGHTFPSPVPYFLRAGKKNSPSLGFTLRLLFMAQVSMRYRYQAKSGRVLARLSDTVGDAARQIAVLPSPLLRITRK